MEKIVYMSSELEKFFQRSLGSWRSHRSYFYANKKEVIHSTTNFIWSPHKDGYEVSWDNKEQNSKGSLICSFYSDNCIYRNRGYFTADRTSSEVLSVSDYNLKTLTRYNSMSFVESIEFLSNELRVRRTIARKEKTGKVFLVGNYVEYKTDGSR